ncbi:MAG: putative lipid II flippase FtsW [Candidatus Limnocylindria bacterium]|nr:putative lipid II flippase FtsW [Candidatus Limnocylindria bacterium]
MKARLPRTTTYDLWLVAVVLGLLALGLAMVYSASGIRALDVLDDPSFFLFQQSLWATVGLLAMVFFARLDYHRLRPFALPLLVLVFALLIVVLVPGIGTRAGGAARWIRFGGPLGVQPAELAKLALVLYLAFWLGARGRAIGAAMAITAPFAALVGAVAALVVAEPDLGTTIVIGALALTMYFVAGARLREFGAIGLLAGALVALAAVAQPYRLQRVLTFLDPWSDPRGTGFHTIQALYALALGGPLGEGLGASREKSGFLPAPYTDSIFAVLGEELGLWGTLLVVLLFFTLAFRGIRIALRAPDREGALLATGVTVWLAFQAWVNMAVVASLVPMTGITLPFISYGGSSLVVGLIAIGILLNVGHRSAAQPARLSRAPGGRRDRRSREPAPRRGGGAR